MKRPEQWAEEYWKTDEWRSKRLHRFVEAIQSEAFRAGRDFEIEGQRYKKAAKERFRRE